MPNGVKPGDRSVAEEWLRQKLREIERTSVGLVDQQIESAQLPIRVILADYVRWRRNMRKGMRKETKQVLSRIKKIIDMGGFERLADIRALAIDDALSRLAADRDIKPITCNKYRTDLFNFGKWLAETSEYVTSNPIARAQRVPDDADDDGFQRGTLSYQEACELLKISPLERRVVWATMLWTGIR